jgi:large subunit ribosomal protein L4
MELNTTFEAPLLTRRAARPASAWRCRPTLFDGTVNVPVMHQVVKAFLANQRQGNASTKTRASVTGGNQKPWKQKGTGRARQGSTRAPTGWAVAPSSARRTSATTSRRCRARCGAGAQERAERARRREARSWWSTRFEYDAPRTARMVELLRRLGLGGQQGADADRRREAGGVPERAQPADGARDAVRDVSTYHVLWSDVVLIERRRSATIWSRSGANRSRRRRSVRRPPRRRRRRRRSRREEDDCAQEHRKEEHGPEDERPEERRQEERRARGARRRRPRASPRQRRRRPKRRARPRSRRPVRQRNRRRRRRRSKRCRQASRYDRPPARHGEELGSVPGARRVRVRGASGRDEARRSSRRSSSCSG